MGAMMIGTLSVPVLGADTAVGVGNPMVDITGKLEVLIADDFESGRSKTFFYLRDPDSGRRFELRFDGQPSGHWLTGDLVTVKGALEGGRIQVWEIFRASER